MTRDERIAWCLAQAEEIEAQLPPQVDPHMWDSPRLAAQMWRTLARYLLCPEPA